MKLFLVDFSVVGITETFVFVFVFLTHATN